MLGNSQQNTFQINNEKIVSTFFANRTYKAKIYGYKYTFKNDVGKMI